MASFRDRMIHRTAGACEVMALPTGVRDVVTIRMSFDTWPDFGAGDELTQDVAVALLDKGTRMRDRFEIARTLEDLGARVGFQGSGTRVRCTVRMLSGDEPVVLPLVGEMLRDPSFEVDEVVKVVRRMTGSVRRSATDTAHRAAVLLARHAFDHDHPNHRPEPSEELAELAAMTAPRIAAYHAGRFGGPVRCVAVGDVDVDRIADALEGAFDGWPGHGADARRYPSTRPGSGGDGVVPLSDRRNLDIRMGHAVDIRRDDPEYDALRLAVFALGGNFSARLMSRIRDDRGLTYGIGSGLAGVSTRHGGLWSTAVTLSADRLDEGIAATRAELDLFVDEGLTDEEVEAARLTLAGRFTVSLATTNGLASAILSAEEKGFGVDYLDTYGRRLDSVTRESANAAVAKWLTTDSLFVAVAGERPHPAGDQDSGMMNASTM